MKDSKSVNLIQSWLEIERAVNKRNIIYAVRRMNNELDTKYMTARIRKWLIYTDTGQGRGTRLPRRVRIYMSGIVIQHVLLICGASKQCIAKIDTNKLINMIH